jgi:hypothetical protein
MDSQDYFERKKNLLNECISMSEDMLSDYSDIDSINSILSIRSEKITALQELEDASKNGVGLLSETQKAQINRIIDLLLDLDRDVEKKIKTAQSELKNEMKINTQNQKLISYTGKHIPVSGRVMDYKK